ncbi:MAG: hypothetical protein PHS37_01205 [Candidatus Omnitrophica bacterium]|nr:hypothetical protein [Candidatus Omnitrophota bacterium]
MKENNAFVESLKKCLTAEENAIGMVSKFLDDNAFLADLNEGDRKVVLQMLRTIKEDSRRHKAILQEMAGTIQEY